MFPSSWFLSLYTVSTHSCYHFSLPLKTALWTLAHSSTSFLLEHTMTSFPEWCISLFFSMLRVLKIRSNTQSIFAHTKSYVRDEMGAKVVQVLFLQKIVWYVPTLKAKHWSFLVQFCQEEIPTWLGPVLGNCLVWVISGACISGNGNSLGLGATQDKQ